MAEIVGDAVFQGDRVMMPMDGVDYGDVTDSSVEEGQSGVQGGGDDDDSDDNAEEDADDHNNEDGEGSDDVDKENDGKRNTLRKVTPKKRKIDSSSSIGNTPNKRIKGSSPPDKKGVLRHGRLTARDERREDMDYYLEKLNFFKVSEDMKILKEFKDLRARRPELFAAIKADPVLKAKLEKLCDVHHAGLVQKLLCVDEDDIPALLRAILLDLK